MKVNGSDRQRSESVVRRLARAPRLLRLAGRLPLMLASSAYVVQGDSMRPTLKPGEYLLVSRRAVPTRGSVVVFRDPGQADVMSIKRVVGLPGEWVTLAGDRVYVDDRLLEEPYALRGTQGSQGSRDTAPPVTLPLGPEEYLVLGDARAHSRDSRTFGPIHRSLVVGCTWLCYWPRSSWRVLGTPSPGEARR